MVSVRPTIVLGLACLALVLGVVPFAGLAGVFTIVLAVRVLRQEPRARVRMRAALAVSGMAVIVGLAWVWVYVEPPRRVVRGQSPVVLAVVGNELHSEGSFVTGALYPWAERRELSLASHLQASDSAYSLRIEGLHDETLQVDSVGLIVADHEPSVVLVPTTQETVVAVNGAVESLGPLSLVDAVVDGEPVRTWTVRFPRSNGTTGATRALLVLEARSTPFADEAFARYLGTMGQSMDPFMSWVTKETCSDACRQEVWDDETARLGIALRVSVVGAAAAPQSVAPVGAGGARTFAVLVDVPAGDGPIEIRLMSTPRFWDVARATLAPDAERRSYVTLTPALAELRHGEHVEDARELVSTSDRRRVALHDGDSLDLRFQAPPLAPGQARAIFIALRAHYRVPTGGRRFLNLPVIGAHRSGLVSLPRFASTLSSSVEKPSPDSATTTSAALSTGE